MQPIARNGARLITRQGSRKPLRQRSIPCHHRRHFHESTAYSVRSRTPYGSSRVDGGSEDLHDGSSSTVDNATKSGEGQTSEDKEQSADAIEEQKRVELRRAGRYRRTREVPKPPPIPAWFLKHNVILRETNASPTHQKPVIGKERQIRCIDRETGHTIFTMPFVSAEFLKPPKREGADDKNGVARPKHRTNDSQPADADSALSSGNFFTQKTTVKPPAEPTIKDASRIEDLSQALDPSMVDWESHQLSSADDPGRWAFLEAELAAIAGITSTHTQHRGLWAASHVDISLDCPNPTVHKDLDQYVENIATMTDADLVRIDANDIAELAEDYVGLGKDGPGSFASLAHEVYRGFESVDSTQASRDSKNGREEEEEEDDDEEEEDEEDRLSGDTHRPHSIASLMKLLNSKSNQISRELGKVGGPGIMIGLPSVHARMGSATSSPNTDNKAASEDVVRWDDQRLISLLDNIVDAAAQKNSASKAALQDDGAGSRVLKGFRGSSHPHDRAVWSLDIAGWLLSVLGSAKALEDPFIKLKLAFGIKEVDDVTGNNTTGSDGIAAAKEQPRRTIVHLRDLGDLRNSRLGDAIVKRLVRVVQKRRRAGEEMLIIGTTAHDNTGVMLRNDDGDELFRPLTVPPVFEFGPDERSALAKIQGSAPKPNENNPSYDRVLEINLRHIQDMLRRLDGPNMEDVFDPTTTEIFDLPTTLSRTTFTGLPTHVLRERVLPQEEVQRVVLTAIGLTKDYMRSAGVKPIHIAMAVVILGRSERSVVSWEAYVKQQQAPTSGQDHASEQMEAQLKGLSGTERVQKQHELLKIEANKLRESTTRLRIENLKKKCSPHELKLLSGVVDAHNIKTTFDGVHAPPETIDALKTLTSLSLLRPDAFKYGVLANDRLPGLLLYGPPGTGKTMLAKAVAKESKATVLEVSGAQIYEKYVGEGEKMVKAVFSLAKKLSPCIVFIDEADALFGSRGGAGSRNTHREIINQFLREWDGMDDHSVFMMVATNRPFDLDDAVLRRLPRRLLVDLPVTKDRESILRIHLQGENLDSDVSLVSLAEQTPLYSGSDLKNVCVAAALACVREENELVAAKKKDDPEFKLPEKRTLNNAHFTKAMAEISASVSEDMRTLAAIRKFDEQYGDRRGRRKKSGYGFGGGESTGADDNAARVRQDEARP